MKPAMQKVSFLKIRTIPEIPEVQKQTQVAQYWHKHRPVRTHSFQARAYWRNQGALGSLGVQTGEKVLPSRPTVHVWHSSSQVRESASQSQPTVFTFTTQE